MLFVLYCIVLYYWALTVVCFLLSVILVEICVRAVDAGRSRTRIVGAVGSALLRVPLRAGMDLGEHDRDGAPHRQEPAAVRQPRLRHRLPHHRLVSAHLRHPDAHSGSTQWAVDGFRNEIIVSRWTIVGEGMLVALNEIARFLYCHHPAFHSVSCHLPPRILSASTPYQLCQRALVALNDGRHVTQSCRWISK